MANKVTKFFREAKQELAKVTWPSKDELLGSTMVVIVMTFILAAYIGAVDFVLSALIRIIIR